MNIFKESPIPLYYQIQTILRGKIEGGEYAPGDSIPTEDELVKSYRVSRITVRKALSLLENQGLIERKRGKGSFVKKGRKNLFRPMKLSGMIEDIIAMNVETKVKLIDFKLINPPSEIQRCLDLKETDKALKIERIRMVKGLPFSYAVSYVRPDAGAALHPQDLKIHPLYEVLEKKCNVKIRKGFQVIEATLADSKIASFLDVMTGTPLLRITRTVYDAKGVPLEHNTILYRSDRYQFAVNLIREKDESIRRWDVIGNNPKRAAASIS